MTTADIRVGVRTRSIARPRLRYIRQLGATDIFIDHANIDEEPDEFNDREADVTLEVGRDAIPTVEQLETARDHAEATDLRIAGIHSLPHALYGDIMFGHEGAEEALDQITTLIENLGEADIPILGYQWNPRDVVPMRTGPVELRDGAVGTGFDYDELENPDELAPGLDREYTEEEFWENFQRFLETVVPVAEEAGVDLALHPVDPPVLESMCGIPRLCRSVENFEKANGSRPERQSRTETVSGLFLPDERGRQRSVTHVQRAQRDRLHPLPGRHRHRPKVPRNLRRRRQFRYPEVIRSLYDIGYDGVVIPDHVPQIEGDSDWRHRGRGYTIGYLRGAIDAVGSDR